MFSNNNNFFKKRASWSIYFLCLVALLSVAGPIYRSFLGIMINTNEGWNAFYADAAIGGMKLYPSLDLLITNNYPPLSFYCVGAIGKMIGDTILAGRLLSLAGLFVIAFLIVKIVRKLGGSWKAGLVGGAYFIATLSLFFRWYVGANDPQLLAQAVMVFGFFLFLNAEESRRGYWPAQMFHTNLLRKPGRAMNTSLDSNFDLDSMHAYSPAAKISSILPHQPSRPPRHDQYGKFGLAMLVMIIAGFFKHNMIALPLAALLWLTLQRRWRVFFFCCGFSLLIIAMGFACCQGAYGADFFHNLFTPRQFLLGKITQEFVDLYAVAIGLGIWMLVGWKFRKEPSVQCVTIMILTGLVVGGVQRLGSGVFVNAQFDLVVALSIGMGVAFNEVVRMDKDTEGLQVGLVLLLTLPFLMLPVFLPFSSAYRAKMVCLEQRTAARIATVRAIPGDVFCESYIAYRAGKPFVVDAFNVEERIQAGKLPPDVITQRLQQHTLTGVNYVWDKGIE